MMNMTSAQINSCIEFIESFHHRHKYDSPPVITGGGYTSKEGDRRGLPNILLKNACAQYEKSDLKEKFNIFLGRLKRFEEIKNHLFVLQNRHNECANKLKSLQLNSAYYEEKVSSATIEIEVKVESHSTVLQETIKLFREFIANFYFNSKTNACFIAPVATSNGRTHEKQEILDWFKKIKNEKKPETIISPKEPNKKEKRGLLPSFFYAKKISDLPPAKVPIPAQEDSSHFIDPITQEKISEHYINNLAVKKIIILALTIENEVLPCLISFDKEWNHINSEIIKIKNETKAKLMIVRHMSQVIAQEEQDALSPIVPIVIASSPVLSNVISSPSHTFSEQSILTPAVKALHFQPNPIQSEPLEQELADKYEVNNGYRCLC